jgi:glycolate oxidase FAD binding subunit
METFAPSGERETVEVVSSAIANETPLEVRGTGGKQGLGRPSSASAQLTTEAMSGVSLYEPAELCLRAGSGTPVRDIVNLLSQRGQELAFEPMDYGALYGREPLSGTIGGLIGVNACGPRRIKAGSARDHLLGFRAVSGRGEVFQSGGRVMKNVTGYDLSKLMTGSHGTLAVLTEVTLKVLPKPETEQTLITAGLEDSEAIAILTEASGLPHDASSLAHVPAKAAGSLGIEYSGKSVTAMRLEGPDSSIEKRRSDLAAHFKTRCRDFYHLDETRSKTFWSAIRDVISLAALDADIWRISTAPTEGSTIVSRLLRGNVPLKSWYYDWAGGLIWVAVEPAPDAHAAAIRNAVDMSGGHATLIRAPDGVRAVVPVFHPQPGPLAALTARVKTSFDPLRILNRGRMREDL